MREKTPENALEFLEELRSIALTGLQYEKNHYAQELYERLLRLASIEYSKICSISPDVISNKFRKELGGHITPKVAVEAAVLNEENKILLVKRSDDHKWCMPCGWCELGETVHDAIRREIFEETGFNTEVKGIIDIFSRMPGDFGQPHTSYHILFHCVINGGKATTSNETIEVKFWDPSEVTEWHREQKSHVERAYKYLREHKII